MQRAYAVGRCCCRTRLVLSNGAPCQESALAITGGCWRSSLPLIARARRNPATMAIGGCCSPLRHELPSRALCPGMTVTLPPQWLEPTSRTSRTGTVAVGSWCLGFKESSRANCDIRALPVRCWRTGGTLPLCCCTTTFAMCCRAVRNGCIAIVLAPLIHCS